MAIQERNTSVSDGLAGVGERIGETMATHDVGTIIDRAYRYVTTPIARSLARYRWITPNRVSVAAFLVGGIGVPALILTQPLWIAGVAFAVSDLLDYLDGDVARAQGSGSKTGDILDGVLDRYTDFFIISALIYANTMGHAHYSDFILGNLSVITPLTVLLIGLAALLGSLVPSYIQAVTVANGLRTIQSIGGRGTRNRIVIVGLLFAQPLWLLVFLAVLGNFGAVHRLYHSLRAS